MSVVVIKQHEADRTPHMWRNSDIGVLLDITWVNQTNQTKEREVNPLYPDITIASRDKYKFNIIARARTSMKDSGDIPLESIDRYVAEASLCEDYESTLEVTKKWVRVHELECDR